MKLADNILKHVVNVPGWSTKRKIVVIESDDWGSIRMSSLQNREALIQKGFPFQNQVFNLYDSLESNEDLSQLFEVLTNHKDSTGRHPVFTAVSVVANPDFEKIKIDSFQNYHYELFTETLKRYPKHDKVFDLYKRGQQERLFYPVFHGREHLNVQRWMRALQSGNQSVRTTFEHGVTGVHLGINDEFLGDFQAAFDLDNPADLGYQADVLKDGLDLFEKTWNYKPTYFVCPNGPFNNSLCKTLADNDIKYLYGERIQNEPQGNGKFKKHIHYIGQKNKYNQVYLTRNAFFEPVNYLRYSNDSIDICLRNIELAFRWNKPATISTHRVNYIGFIDPYNQQRNLKLLDILLTKILERWPETEFMTSVELGQLIEKNEMQ